MEININNGPFNGHKINIAENGVTILIGKNGTGKTKILNSLKSHFGNDAVLLQNNYESVSGINSINLASVINELAGNHSPIHVASLVANDKNLFEIFRYFFKVLFNVELKIKDNAFNIGDYQLNSDADGLRSMFNLIYYLISPFKIVLLDEPERFLHPSMRDAFIVLLSEVAKNYEKKIIITSHSEKVIRYDLENVDIMLLQRDPDIIIDIRKWIMSVNNTDYPGSNNKKSFVDWFYYHTNILFSDNVILVEGISDQIILNALKNKFTFQFGLDSLTISHVASSHHETGGKSRLHKVDSFLSELVNVAVIADKDIISSDLKRWGVVINNSNENETIQAARKECVYILSKGEIEDYYFCDANYEYCKDPNTAKSNKVSAAFEQARIINSTGASEVMAQFGEIIEMMTDFCSSEDHTNILKNITRDYINNKYIKKEIDDEHVFDKTSDAGTEVFFRFTSPAKYKTITAETIEQLKKAGDSMNSELDN